MIISNFRSRRSPSPGRLAALGTFALAASACGGGGDGASNQDAAIAQKSTAASGATASCIAPTATGCVSIAPPPKHVPGYVVPGTAQQQCYSDTASIACPTAGQTFYGQDATHPGPPSAFLDRGDGTVIDRTTGLMWTHHLSGPISHADALAAAPTLRLGGFSDWRVPTVKELYSLMDYRGRFGPTAAESQPFIDTNVFEFFYLEEAPGGGSPIGQRFIDVQIWSATRYVATTMNGDATIFGVNFADGRVKGYPLYQPGSNATVPYKMYARYVRGGPNPRGAPSDPNSYGFNALRDNGNGSVTDAATRLTWQRIDDGVTRPWAEALAYCENLVLAERSDWRLPNAKELQGIVDYRNSPSYNGQAAITPPLAVSNLESYFWTSSTLLDGPAEIAPSKAAYIAFGRALGWVQVPPGSGAFQLIDVHGAGAQRADPKAGDPAAYPLGLGPQGDEVRIRNHVRCVRGPG